MKIRSYMVLVACLLTFAGTLQSCDKLKEHFSDSRGRSRDRDRDADEDSDDPDADDRSARERGSSDAPDAEFKDIPADAPQQNRKGDGPFYGVGTIDTFPYSLDITIADGKVSGTFWNILYDIKLPASGTFTNDGMLRLDLGSGSSLSHLQMHTDDGYNFTGVWGKKKKRVTLRLRPGSRSTSPGSYSGQKITIKGGGMTTHALLVDNSDGTFFYFPNQPAGNRLPMEVDYSNDTYTLYSPNDRSWLATIRRNGSTGTIENSSGKCFDVTFN